MVKFYDVEETTQNKRLDYGKHLVKIVEVRNTTKDGEELLDKNGVEQWSVTFEDSQGAKHYEYFSFGGKMANKTGYLFRACGLLDEDEKISESNKEWKPSDIQDCYLYIEIVENTKATDEKWKKQIKFDGFEKYEKPVKKAKPKVVEDDEIEELPF